MKITKQKDGSSMVVTLTGRLDTESASKLDEALKNDLSELDKLTFDFENLDYISSAGLRELLKAKRNMKYGGTVTVINASEIVTEVFNVTGFDSVVDLA